MKKEMIISIVFLWITTIWNIAAHAELQVSEKDAILAIVDSIPEWSPLTETICLWDIVTCDESHITELILNEKGIENLPEEIGQLTKLIRLDLSANILETLPEAIGDLQQLTEINLSTNKLSILPDSIGQLHSLLELDLGNNLLDEVFPETPQKRQLPPDQLPPDQPPPDPNNPPAPLAQLEKLTQLKTLKLNGNRLKQLPLNLDKMTSLETLYLNNNEFTEFPSIITKLSHLTILNLYQNSISSLPINMNNYSSLQELNLSNNELEILSDGIGQLTALISLSIASNMLSSISLEIGSLKKLTNLSLENNVLSSLPASISQLESLTTLNLENNALQSLAETVVNWKHLISLSLSNNLLKELPDDFGSLEALKTLDMDKNVLEQLPDSFGQLTLLERLTLSTNNLHVLPASFNQLKNLLYLDLSNNQLIELPEQFSQLELPVSFNQLKSLLYLDLSNNQLMELPEQFSQLDRLQTLNISSNRLAFFPSDFGGLRNLRYLYASSNEFKGSLGEDFSSLQSIQEIDLSDNHLGSLPNSFSSLGTLQTLNLSSNNIEALPYSFGELDNLQTVNLSNNRIKELKTDFGNLSFLSHLYLSNNDMKKLPKEIGMLNNLIFIDLSYNQIETIPQEIGSLSRLFTLNLSNNNIRALPEEFGGMDNLRTLLLTNNNFVKFPDVIIHNTKLLSLDLSNNLTMTGNIPITFSNFDDLTDLQLENTELYTYSQKMADFINERCRSCEFSPEETKILPDNDNELILSGITSTTDKLALFKVSDVIDIVLLFNSPVKLEQGSMVVTFNTGYTTTISSFDTYTNSVNCTYTIHAGDSTEALNVSQVSLSGGTLTEESGRNAVLDLPTGANLSDNKIFSIDGVYPEVTITQPEDGQCVDYLDMIKGTASDEFGIKTMEVTISNYTRTTEPAEFVYKLDEWIADMSTLYWEPDMKNDENSSPENLKFEKFVLKENVSYTINVSVFDNVENKSETQTTFTYKKQKSQISCILSSSQLTIGEKMTITGAIIPADSAISDVRIEMKSDAGFVTTKKISANRDGSFSYTTECTDFNYAGLWYIKTIFDGGSCISESESVSQSIIFVKADTELVLSATEEAIRKNDLFSISGKLTPTPGCDADLSGLNLLLYFNGPDHLKPLIISTTINTKYGLFLKKDFQLSEQYPDQDVTGQWSVSAFFPETDIYNSSTSQIMSLDVLDSAGYAIIVQGKISNEEGLASHQKTSDFVYNQFLNRGLNDNNDNDNLNDILYFSYAAPGESGYTYIDNAPSKSLVQEAITVWAKKKMNAYPGPLYIVMVDHGLEDQFLMNDEVITSSELAAWQDNLQNELSGPAKEKGIVTILGFCHSGSFIDELSGAYRIIITSAAKDEFSYKGPLDNDNIREGEYFISEFFKKVALGKNIRTCFEEAAILTEKFTGDLSGNSANYPPYYDNSPQHPLLDDNADGKGSNSLDSTNSDGYFSSQRIIGVSSLSTNAATDVAIDAVTETLFLAHDEKPSDPFFWAQISNHDTLLHLWIEIKKPSYTIEQASESGQKEMNLKKISTANLNAALNRYEWNGSDDLNVYFDEPGIYQIFYFAKDKNSNNVSEFMDSIVYKNKADNQSPLPFSLISPQDGTQLSTKGVLFDCTYNSGANCYTIFSWEETSDPDDNQITYNLILSKNDSSFSDPIKYNDDRLLNNSMSINLKDEFEGADIYWKVQAIDQYGAIQESSVYHFKTISVTNPDTGTIKGYVYDSVTKAPIYRAMVNMESASMRTSSRGYYHGGVEPQLYETISVVAENYQTQYLYSVTIGNGETLEQNITLQPEVINIIGDINNDYTIDLFDLIAGIQILADIYNDNINISADIDADQVIGMAEIIYIVNELSGNN
ncbi:leucine rich repeat protein [Candidatus Magnetomorum sp. HK-1]|nr:leucine rich repeat protein [Candidatus Magnetomorum sp. HK-1]